MREAVSQFRFVIEFFALSFSARAKLTDFNFAVSKSGVFSNRLANYTSRPSIKGRRRRPGHIPVAKECSKSMQPFRFIHAADLLLDHLPDGIDWSDPELAAVAEQSTLTAFRQIVETAIVEEVDFLLLTGNCFDPADRSMQSETELIHGIEQLEAEGIGVFIVPGKTDPPHVWQTLARLPENVTVLRLEGDSPHEIKCDSELIASIHVNIANNARPTRQSGEEVFPIVVQCGDEFSIPATTVFEEERLIESVESEPASEPVRHAASAVQNSSETHLPGEIGYWALMGGESRRTVRFGRAVAHAPGSVQALAPSQTGSHGCTLVEVESTGAMQLTFVPTGPLRYETIAITFETETRHEELFERIAAAVGEIHRQPTDEAWFVSWTMSGDGPLRKLAADLEFHREVDRRIRERFSENEFPIRNAGMSPQTGYEISLQERPAEGLVADYLEQLNQVDAIASSDAEDEIPQPFYAKGIWSSRLRELSENIETHQVRNEAAQWGRCWFAECTEEQV